MLTIHQELQDQPKERLLAEKGKLLKLIKRSVYVYRVDCGGCNGCEIEIFAAITPLFDAERFGIKVVDSPRHADVLVYTGPMTRMMRLPAIRAYRAAPDPKLVVAYGACGCSGGIFHDSYAVWGGTDAIIPVDLYIPGCPPTPPATIYGFALVMGLLGQKIKGEHFVEEDTRVQLPFPGIPPDLYKEITGEARRLCGYWRGKQIAGRYLELLMKESDPVRVERQLKEMLKEEDDPRLVEVFSNLHHLYLKYLQGADSYAQNG